MLSLLAQVADPSQSLGWGSQLLNFGTAGVVALILGWQLKLSYDREGKKDEAHRAEMKAKDDVIRAKDQELHDTNEKLLALAERALPVLGEAAQVLGGVTRRGGGDTDENNGLRRQLRRIETQLGDMGRGTGGRD